MIVQLKKFYIGLGLDVAPPGSWRRFLHRLLRLAWLVGRIALMPYRFLHHASYFKYHAPPTWVKAYSPIIPSPVMERWQARVARGKNNNLHVCHRFTLTREKITFDMDAAVMQADVRGIALIYFMGMGDYLFTTPLVEALAKRYPQLPIIACLSRNASITNAPMAEVLMRTNPLFADVLTYDGHETTEFRNYDYSDALKQIPAGYISVPMLYEHQPYARHRVDNLFSMFNLACPAPMPVPVLYDQPVTGHHVLSMVYTIRDMMQHHQAKGVVFMQMDARSSVYSHPDADGVATGLHDRGYIVVSVTRLKIPKPMTIELDFSVFSIVDSIALLRLLRQNFPETYVLAITSVFWPVSAALGIPTLGIHHFVDPMIHTYWYPNAFVITHYDYKEIPASRRFLATAKDYSLNSRSQADFNSGYILQCFDVWRAFINRI